jgi:hypothetical protein
MQDPKGISGYVSACATATKKAEALSKLSTAKTRAEKAQAAKNADRIREAFAWWDKVFAGNFPSYYY